MQTKWRGGIAQLFLVLSCIGILSCSKKIASEQELKAYILNEENGLHKVRSKGDFSIEVSYKPSDLVWANDLMEMKNEEARNVLRKQYDSLQYFIIRISRNGQEIENAFVSDPAHFTKVINYLSFEMSRDIFLVNGQDTTRALDAVYSRTFGGSTGTSVMAVFGGDLNDKNGDVKICLNDTMLGVGSAEFDFKISDIKNIPTLTFN